MSRRCHGHRGRALPRGAGCRARAEANRENLRLAQKRTGDALGMDRLNGDFEPVLAGVAGAADDRRRAGNRAAHDFHEDELVDARRVTLQRRAGSRPLQREQRTIGPRLQRGDAFQFVGDIGEVVVLGARALTTR